VKALTWHGRRDVRVETVPDPRIEKPTDAVIRVTSSGLCGSDLHLYEMLGMYLEAGDVLGHEPIGIVEEVGSEVPNLEPGDRVVVPFNIACGSCFMCDHQLFAQCETTQVREQGRGAALFGYTKLYGRVPGAQAQYLRVPHANFGPIRVPQGPPDERYVYLSDVLPTAWQAVAFADVPPGGSVLVVGLGPIGQMSARIARHRGAGTVMGVDLVPERIAMAARHGVRTFQLEGNGEDEAGLDAFVAEHTNGRGADSVIEAVGMEAHGSPGAKLLQSATAALPDAIARPLLEKAGIDSLAALYACFRHVRRSGTVSIVGVYGGQADPFPMMDLFDKGVQVRMGQAHVKRWIPELLPLLEPTLDPLGIDDLTTHVLPLSQAPRAYEMFQKKEDGAVKILFRP
jgi:threonine dehydrogenase-like Zn-dependent dehydrogenase